MVTYDYTESGRVYRTGETPTHEKTVLVSYFAHGRAEKS